MDVMPKSLDATDALAVAVCHHFNSGTTMVQAAKSILTGLHS
jgi:Holliday junction resolvasome RuvABC endonuclease subunit